MSFINKVSKLAQSEKGKEALAKAKEAASDPEKKQKLTEAADKAGGSLSKAADKAGKTVEGATEKAKKTAKG